MEDILISLVDWRTKIFVTTEIDRVVSQTRNNSNESGKCPTSTGWEQRCFYWLSQNNSHGLSNHGGGTTTGQSYSSYVVFISGSFTTLSDVGKSCQTCQAIILRCYMYIKRLIDLYFLTIIFLYIYEFYQRNNTYHKISLSISTHIINCNIENCNIKFCHYLHICKISYFICIKHAAKRF